MAQDDFVFRDLNDTREAVEAVSFIARDCYYFKHSGRWRTYDYDLKAHGFADVAFVDVTFVDVTGGGGQKAEERILNAADTQFVSGEMLPVSIGGRGREKADLALKINLERLKPGLRAAIASVTDDDADNLKKSLSFRYDLTDAKQVNRFTAVMILTLLACVERLSCLNALLPGSRYLLQLWQWLFSAVVPDLLI